MQDLTAWISTVAAPVGLAALVALGSGRLRADDEDCPEKSIALGIRFPDSALRLRIGQKFNENKAFTGFSIKTL
jgi:hypothetical protein